MAGFKPRSVGAEPRARPVCTRCFRPRVTPVLAMPAPPVPDGRAPYTRLDATPRTAGTQTGMAVSLGVA